ncbi:MAG: peptidase U32 family protein [Bulleidia sp.]
MKTVAMTCSNRTDIKEYADHHIDEVIVTMKDSAFSAMREMSEEEIMACIEEAHAYGMKVSLLANRLFDQDEIDDMADRIIGLLEKGLDSVIFADPGLLMKTSQAGYGNHMIYQPDTLVTSSFDASFWMEQGIQSTVLSSLITKDEIALISAQVHGLSLIIHGRLLMSVSKRKLLKSFRQDTGLAYESEYNRNLYLVEEKRDGRMPVYEDDHACMIFSDFVQESFDEIPLFTDIARYVIDASWLEKDEALQAADIYHELILGKDMRKQIDAYRSTWGKEKELSDGYYGLKTIR